MAGELEKLQIEYQRTLEEYYALRAQYEDTVERIYELEALTEFLNELKDKKDVEGWTNLGGMIFVKSKVKDVSKVLVNIGNSVYVEKPVDEVIDVLKRQKEGYEKILSELGASLDILAKRLVELRNRIKELAEK